MRMRKKKNLAPRMERCQSVWIRQPEQMRGHWRDLMDPSSPLYLELGCGKGRFTCECAAMNPETLYIAVERVPDAMVMAMERAEERQLHNVFFVDADAACLNGYFKPGEVDRIYLNFCDPWPSKGHAKRRLTHPDFLNRYAEVLRGGGRIEFKTDNQDLFEWSLLQFPKAGFDLEEISRDLHRNGIRGVMTDYEAKFHEQGNPIYRCTARRRWDYRPILPPDRRKPKEDFQDNSGKE